MKNKIYFFLIILLSACHSKTQPPETTDEAVVDSFRVIDLENNLDVCDEPPSLSLFVDSISYVKLETTEKSLLGKVHRVQLTPEFIYLCAFTNKRPVMYSRNGEFIRFLGKIGQGPGEFLAVQDITASDSLIYIKSNYKHELSVYDVHTNEFVREVIFPKKYDSYVSESAHMSLLGNNVVLYPGCSSESLDLPVTSSVACIIDPDNAIVANQEPYLSPSFLSNRPGFMVTSFIHPWWYDGHSNAYSLVNDTIYGVAQDSIFPRYLVNLGKYKMPVEEYDMRKGGRASYISIESFVETKEILLFTFAYNLKCWLSVYDKRNGLIRSWNTPPVKAINGMAFGVFSVVNDLDGGSNVGGYTYIADSKHLFSVIDSDNKNKVREDLQRNKDVKFPEKRMELMKMIDEMGEDENPIIVFYKLKN